MAAQNIVSLGLDISTFNDQKRTVLNEFIALFNQLEKYDGIKINPIMGEGLAEFNKSIAETSRLLSDLDVRLSNLNNNIGNVNKSNSTAAASTNELSYAEKELIRINELLDKTYAKIALSTSDEAKYLAELKVQLREVTRANQDEAKAKNSLAIIRTQERDRIRQEKEELLQVVAAHRAEAEIKRQEAIEEKKNAELRASGLRIMNSETAASSGSVEGLGRSLTHSLGVIRTLAYILPGIGMAGIFNLAFEAISAATDELFKFAGSTEELIGKEERLNKLFIDLRSNVEAFNNSIKERYNVTEDPVKQEERALELLKARGTNQKTILENENSINEARLKFLNTFNFDDPKALDKIKTQEVAVQNILGQINNINSAIADKRSYIDPQTKSYITDEDDLKNKKKSLEEQFQNEKASLDDLTKRYSEYHQTVTDLAKDQNEQLKFNNEQERKFVFETTKEKVQLQIAANQEVLKDDRSTYTERLKAFRNLYADQLKLNSNEFTNVRDNPATNPRELDIARNKLLEENKKANISLNENTLKLDVEFYQRYIVAITALSKSEVEKHAIANEKVFKNDEKTLDDRIAAYTKYIIEKQRLYQLDEDRDLQKGAKEAGGKTSLTKDEITSIKATSLKNQVDLQADAEKQIYDIVYSSTEKQLKEIVTFNSLSESDRKRAYTDELRNLNDRFENQKVSYEKFQREKDALQKRYRLIELRNNIQDDNSELKRIQDFIKKEKDERQKAQEDVDITGTHLDALKRDGGDTKDAQREYDTAVGRRNALNTTILNSDKELKKAQDKLTDDELAYEQYRIDQMKKAEKEHAEFRKALIDELYNLAKNAIDGEFQYRIQKAQDRQRVIDEEYGSEISAIEQSSLTAKDKAALDVQLNAEKLASDKNAAFEERKLKHDQAVLDRELAIAHILWATEEAVMNALALSGITPIVAEGIAIERGILGAIAAATVLAEPIPYKQGTPVGGHIGGLAKFAEGNIPELVKEPYKSPYFAMTETVAWLPKGTEVIPLRDIDLEEVHVDNSWDQTRWLAKQISKSNKKEIKNIITPHVNVDLGFELYKHQKLGR